MKLLAIWLAFVVLAMSAASAVGAEPQPDAAPQAPAVSPDPAPEAAPQSTEPPASPPAETPTAPAQTQTAAPAPTAPAAPNTPPQPRERAPKRVAKAHHMPAKARPAEHAADGASAGSLVRIHALLPGAQPADDSSSGVFVLAAGALLALVLASGSMASVASRAMKGQLR